MKYIIIGNGQEWCYYCWKSAINNNVVFYNGISEIISNRFLSKICNNHFSKKKVTDSLSPIRKIWYARLYKSLGLKSNYKYVVVFYDYGVLARDLDFIDYIRRKSPHTKLVYLFTNIVRISGARKHGILDILLNYYDQVFAFDPNDAVDYKFELSPLIYTRDINYHSSENCFDVFYVGNAKDRLDTLHEIYKKCKESRLKCCFYINRVPSEKQLYSDIHYNEILTYSEVLNNIAKSRCLVDAIQGGSSAMTLRVCESVIYDKKLITTNESIMQEPYYSPERFLLYNAHSDLKSFVEDKFIGFSESEKQFFAPEEFFKKIKV